MIKLLKCYEEAKLGQEINMCMLELSLVFQWKLTKKKPQIQSPGLKDFINDFIEFDLLPDISINDINKNNLRDKLNFINNVCDNYSHGNIQSLENTNFISNSSLDSIAKDCLSIIEFFDGLHFHNSSFLYKSNTSDLQSET